MPTEQPKLTFHLCMSISCKLLRQFVICPSCNKVHIGCNKKKHWQLTLRWILINTRLAVKIEVDLFQHWQLTLRWTLINTRLAVNLEMDCNP